MIFKCRILMKPTCVHAVDLPLSVPESVPELSDDGQCVPVPDSTNTGERFPFLVYVPESSD